MAEFRTETDQLADGGGRQSALAASLHGLQGAVRAAADGIAGASGHAGAAAAGSAWGAAWATQVAAHAEAVQLSARNLDGAAAAYRETDEGQMRG